MSHQFKPGDLALIVNARRRPEYIGKVVELVAFVRQGDKYQSEQFGGFRAEGDAWVVKGDITGSIWSPWHVKETHGIAMVDPEHLMPLQGTRAEQYEYFRETIKVGAA